MGGGLLGRVVRASLAAVLLASIAACGVSAAADPVELPSFAPASSESDTTTADGPDEGAIPDDCERLLKVADLGAVLGLPLDSVRVRTTVGVAQPSVGRTERVACRYSMKANGPGPGRTLLDMNSSAYVDAGAASRQWRLNADIEDGEHRDLPIGSAGAVLVERGGEALLSVAYESVTLTMVLPDQPLPGGRPRAEALVDLALRVLPSVAPPPSAPPPPPAVDPAAPPPAAPAATTAPAASDGTQ
jgi:hypothetical protein